MQVIDFNIQISWHGNCLYDTATLLSSVIHIYK